MRPKRNTYTLAAASAAGYLSAATGAGPWSTIAGQPSDGTGHQVTIGSAANLSGITLTVTGTDPEGRSETEEITGPNATTVTGTKYFSTVTGVSASSTLGANTMNVGWNAVCVTPAYPVNQYSHNGCSLGVDIGGTVTFSGQETNGPVFSLSSNSLLWSAIANMSGVSADTMKVSDVAMTAVRVQVASHTSGTLTVTTVQDRAV